MKKFLTALTLTALVFLLCAVAFASGSKTFIAIHTGTFREGPSLDSEKICDMVKGDEFVATDFEVDDRGVKWYFGQYKGELGWSSEKNFQEKKSSEKKEEKKTAKPTAKPTATPKPTPIPIDYTSFRVNEYTAEVTATSLNLRAEPAADRKIISAYPTGSILRVIRTNSSWAEVIDDSTGKSGYMSLKYLSKVEATPANVVFPLSTVIDLNAIPDGIYPAEFDSLDLNGTKLKVALYAKEQFSAFEILNLKHGDAIIVSGEETIVSTIASVNGGIEINGGLDNGGLYLAPLGTFGSYVYFGDDDIATYAPLGTVKLELDGSFAYVDSSDPEFPVSATLANVETLISGEFTPYDTNVTIAGGKIVKVERVFRP